MSLNAERANRMAPSAGAAARYWALRLACLAAAFAPLSAARAATESVIFSFGGNGGSQPGLPAAGLVHGPGGVFFGTTSGEDAFDDFVYELVPPAETGASYSLKVLHDFTRAPGTPADIVAAVTRGGNGALFGTSDAGGASGFGTVFELAPASSPADLPTETVLVSFSGGADGGRPQAALITGKEGALFGTAFLGGNQGCADNFGQIGCGVVFELFPPVGAIGHWTEVVIHTFASGSDGARPLAGLLARKSGALFGTTSAGGEFNLGTVFMLTPPTEPGGVWTEKVLHSFQGGSDGAEPLAGLIAGPTGTLFGTTEFGGVGVCPALDLPGCGTVFELFPPSGPGGAWTEAVIHSFTGGAADGKQPLAAVLANKTGALFGTTFTGGPHNGGSVFELTPPASAGGGWTETVLHFFGGADDGFLPLAGLVEDGSGALLGATQDGGAAGVGAVFKVVP